MSPEELVDVYNSLKGGRGTWEQHWEEIAERILPRQMGFLGERTAGEKRTQKIYDSRALIALERFANVMDSMLTPRQTKWHNLKVTNPDLQKMREVQDWFYAVNQRLFDYRYSPKANFAGQNTERWISMGAFGTGCMFIDYDASSGIRYRNVHLKDLFFCENHQGMIDTVYRRISMSARQMEQQFGRDKLPDAVLKKLDDPKKKEEKFEVIHVVMPREDYDRNRADARGKPFASLYITMQEKQLLSEGGYTSFPYAVSRYVTAPGEVYGRGPAMTALPDIKMVNEMSKSDIRATHKLVDPPLLLNDEGVLGGGAMKVDMRPNALNFGGVDKNGRQMIQPFQTGARVDLNESKMEARRKSIDDAFLVTLFQILVETPRMTATEALIRAQEKGMLLTPTMGRQQSEALGPQIEREIDLLMVHNLLPQMPEILIEAGGEFDIIYDSPMSRMQRAEELVGVQRTMELLTPFAQLDPTVLDIIHPDRLAKLTAEVSGVPNPVMRTDKELEELRAQRAEAQQAQQMVESAQPMAGAIKDIAQAQSLGRS